MRILSLALLVLLVGSGCATVSNSAAASDSDPADVETAGVPAESAQMAEDGESAESAESAETAESSETSQEEPEVLSNTLKWATASEVDNFGYDVFRSESEDGPFEKLNDDMIRGAGTTDEVSYYEYEDSTIDPYIAYWYYVESISMSGVREVFTPVQQVAAKRQSPTAEQESDGGDS